MGDWRIENINILTWFRGFRVFRVRSDESMTRVDSPVPLMHHDPDRSWITDRDPDHPKGTHIKFLLSLNSQESVGYQGNNIKHGNLSGTPRSHIRISIYRTWPFVAGSSAEGRSMNSNTAVIGAAVCSSLAVGFLLGKLHGSRRSVEDYIQRPCREFKKTEGLKTLLQYVAQHSSPEHHAVTELRRVRR